VSRTPQERLAVDTPLRDLQAAARRLLELPAGTAEADEPDP